jgi:hypothetical protein
MELRLDYFLDFPFWFAINDVRWQPFEIGAMGLSFSIAGQEVDVENRVDFH